MGFDVGWYDLGQEEDAFEVIIAKNKFYNEIRMAKSP